MQRPLPPGHHVLLILPESPDSLQAEGQAGPAGELIVGGRRYHLVPAPAEDAPTPTTPAMRPASSVLTARELQIVSLVAAGHVNKEIASELSISAWTVSAHLRRIYSKLGVDTRAAMVSRCFGLAPKQE
ncbi:LuxR C-terminal-related transcriptional regulator [Myxococcaceae bacterium GXIMD 01537]